MQKTNSAIRKWFYGIVCTAMACVFMTGCAGSKVPRTIRMDPGAKALIEHNKSFEKRIEKVNDRVFVAIGYALANSIMVVVDGGKVIVDATEGREAAREIKAAFDKIAPGPVLGIIYTHVHPDHVLGASVFHEEGAPIWATDAAGESLNEQFASLSTLLRKRAAKQYGLGLPDDLRISNGLGPFLALDEDEVPPLLYPTDTFSGQKEIVIGGTRFVLVQAPGETREQLFVWIPDLGTLLPGDNIYVGYPNLYSTRGVPPRPVGEWVRSLDKMRDLEPEYLVPSHTTPVKGKKKIAELLTTYRDGIEYIHSAVIRLANQGMSPDQMVQEIRLPDHLANHPYMQEYYGMVSWSVRGIYDGYLGWFDGNPTSLARLPEDERGRRLAELIGGREAVCEKAQQALDDGDPQWAAELADLILAASPDDNQASKIKAEALWRLGMSQSNSNARCYLLTSSLELQGDWSVPPPAKITAETISGVPIDVLIKSFPQRLDQERATDTEMAIVFAVTDLAKAYTFRIRKGVGEVSEKEAENPDLRFEGAEADLKAFLIGELPTAKALSSGKIKMQGGLSAALQFRKLLIKP